MNKPTLRREHLTELGDEQMRELAGGATTIPVVISQGSCVCTLKSLDLRCQIVVSDGTCTCTVA